MRILFLFFLAASLALGITSCKNNEGCTDPFALDYDADATEAGDCDYANLTMQFVAKIGTDDFAYNTPFEINGAQVTFTRAQFYVSRITITGEGEANIYSPESYIVAKPGTTDFSGGQLRAGTIRDLAFNIGIDATTNHLDPSTYPAENPLSADHPDFAHWSWDAGYQFLRLEGTVDLDGDDIADEILEYHIGGDANLRQAAFSDVNQVVDESNEVFTVNVDFAKFFTDIDLSTESITHTGDFPAIAQKIVENIPSAFTR